MIADGGYIYVCGATSMGKQVRDELELALGSADYLERLKTEQRYVEELWNATSKIRQEQSVGCLQRLASTPPPSEPAKSAPLPGCALRVEGLAREPAKSAEELKAVFQRGLEQRAVAENAMNAESSRSHVIFTVFLAQDVPSQQGGVERVTSKLHFCDLGGCERLKKTEVEQDRDRRLEAIEINKSLSALGDVIEAIAKKRKYIPYRNHKLTQLLQDALGGSAKALMYVNCSPAQSSIKETVTALKLASHIATTASEKCKKSFSNSFVMGAFALPVQVSCSGTSFASSGGQPSLALNMNITIPLVDLMATLADLQKASQASQQGPVQDDNRMFLEPEDLEIASLMESRRVESKGQEVAPKESREVPQWELMPPPTPQKDLQCQTIRITNLIKGLKSTEVESVFSSKVGPVRDCSVRDTTARITFDAANHAKLAVERFNGSILDTLPDVGRWQSPAGIEPHAAEQPRSRTLRARSRTPESYTCSLAAVLLFSSVSRLQSTAKAANSPRQPVPWNNTGTVLRDTLERHLGSEVDSDCHYRRGDCWLTLAAVKKVQAGTTQSPGTDSLKVLYKGSIIKVALDAAEEAQATGVVKAHRHPRGELDLLRVLPNEAVPEQRSETLLAGWAAMRSASEMLAEVMQDCERDSFDTVLPMP
ncbi:KIN14E [Symbiodinium sp. CCMP2592]|nr:KIN14E [Symbiodinium sp. CCMP2592]